MLWLLILSIPILYIVKDSLNNKTITYDVIANFLIFFGLVECVIGVLQLYNIVPSLHDSFAVTGTFFNPAPFAGYLAFVLPWVVVKFLHTNQINDKTNLHQTKLYFYGLTTAFIVLLLPATQSRAAWLAALVAMWIIFAVEYKIIDRVVLFFKNRKYILFTISGFLVVGVLLVLYFIRPDSANARIFIWTVCSDYITQHPIFGAGIGRFVVEYNNQQATYISTHTLSDSAWLNTGFVDFAFNDYIQTAFESGIVGLLLFLITCGSVLYANRIIKVSDEYYAMKLSAVATLTAILVFGLFSYPLQIPALWIVFVLNLAILSFTGKYTKLIVWNLNKKLSYVLLILGLVVCSATVYAGVNQKIGYDHWTVAEKYYYQRNHQTADYLYQKAFPYLSNNGVFLTMYGKNTALIGKYPKAIELLEKATTLHSETFLYYTLGDCYTMTGQYDKAEKAYNHAANMVPSQFYPKYLLVNMYLQSKQKEKAKLMASNIINMRIKVNSTAVEQIKNEMTDLVKQ